MTRTELEKLLEYPEQTWLDWKREFPKGLEQPAKTPEHRLVRGAMLKDIQALANVQGAGSRYLVWGVKDVQVKRNVYPFTPPPSFDDANFQDWVENAFDPSITFIYHNVAWDAGAVIGVFQIYPLRDGPAVAVEDFGEVLRKGKVWFRNGTRNTVALRAELKSYFQPAGIDFEVGFLEHGQLERQVRLPSLRRKLAATQPPSRVEVQERLGTIRQLAADERNSPESTPDSDDVSLAPNVTIVLHREPYKVEAQRIESVLASLERHRFTASKADFEFAGLSRLPLGQMFGSTVVGGSAAKFKVFCEVERELKRYVHEVEQCVFTNAFG